MEIAAFGSVNPIVDAAVAPKLLANVAKMVAMATPTALLPTPTFPMAVLSLFIPPVGKKRNGMEKQTNTVKNCTKCVEQFLKI